MICDKYRIEYMGVIHLKYFPSLILFLLLFFSLYHAEQTIQISQQALTIWIEKLIPSLFFPTFCIRMLYDYRFFHALFSRLSFPSIWNIDSKRYPDIFVGWLIGFPNYAVLLEEAHQQNRMNETTSIRLLSCISCSALPFLWLTIGIGIFQSRGIALQLWFVQILSNLVLLYMTRHSAIQASTNILPAVSFMKLTQKHLYSTALTMFYIGGYILIVQVSIALLPLAYLRPFLQIISEFASGSFYLSRIIKAPLLLPSIGALIGFGGLSVHLQTFSLIPSIQISYVRYFIFRTLQAILVFLFLLLMQFFF